MKPRGKYHFKLHEIEKKNIFSVPKGYFDSLPNHIEGQLLATGSLLPANIFLVPDQYFENLPTHIQTKILHQHPLANPLLEKGIYLVPGNYFHDLSIDLQQIAQENLVSKEIVENIHTVPEGYFDSLSSQIQAKIQSSKPKEPDQVFLMPALRYAMAACILLAVLISGLYFFRPSSPPLSQAHKKPDLLAGELIARLHKKDIQHYLEHQEDLEGQELLEFASFQKRKKIHKEFEREFFLLDKEEKQTLELELDDLDVSELQTDI